MRIDGYCTLGKDREFDLTAENLLHAMDLAEVNCAVIAPPDRQLAVSNREGNAAMLQSARSHPGRLIPACAANPWYGARALDEVRISLAAGARLLVVHPFVQGFQLNDELILPLLELAATERVPVYVHTGMPGNSTPWQLVDLAERFPALDFIMGHCGATDFWPDVPEAARAASNVYLESSLARPFTFSNHLKSAGFNRGIMGSSAPLNDFCFEWRQIRACLPPEHMAGVCGQNLLKLLLKRSPL